MIKFSLCLISICSQDFTSLINLRQPVCVRVRKIMNFWVLCWTFSKTFHHTWQNYPSSVNFYVKKSFSRKKFFLPSFVFHLALIKSVNNTAFIQIIMNVYILIYWILYLEEHVAKKPLVRRSDPYGFSDLMKRDPDLDQDKMKDRQSDVNVRKLFYK